MIRPRRTRRTGPAAPEPHVGEAGTPAGDAGATRGDRYLGLLKDALLDRHYLENEVRLEYLASLPPGREPDAEALRDPARTLEVRYQRLLQSRRAGRSTDEPRGSAYTPYTDMGRAALDHLHHAVEDVLDRCVAGDLVECGVGRGGGGVLMRACLEVHGDPSRRLWMVDPFLATAPPRAADSEGRARMRADLTQVRDAFDRFDLLDDRVRFVQGAYEATLPDAPITTIGLLRVGIDAAFDVGRVLRHLLPLMAPGGTVVVEGVGRQVIDERLLTARPDSPGAGPLERVDWNTVAWTVHEPPHRRAPARRSRPAPPRVSLAPERRAGPVDLSVVVVFHDMRREAMRTLRSLSRSYQRGLDDVTYEVLVMDNGSPPRGRLTPEEVEAFGREFRLLDVEDAPPSPTVALNHGIAESRGDVVALMIDGAHVLTPGVLRHALTGMRTYAPAVVAVQQWYVGPGQQGDAQQAGYEQTAEDRLFAGIRWPTDGYRLFEIGHFIGDRDWFDGIVESNCLFAPRTLLEQVGGFDDSFAMPGGGYANLELFERLHSHPGVTLVTVLGEGTFHQFHGGTTTNVADADVRRARIVGYAEHFRAVRGRGLLGVTTPVHYVGTLTTKAARRTRSRREALLSFAADRDPTAPDGAPPQPVPDELKLATIEALWAQQSWREATWLGHPVLRYPTDLQTYQEIVHELQPGVVIIASEDGGVTGRTLHAAAIQGHVGPGRVVVVGRALDPVAGDHPAVTHLALDPADPAARAAVADAVGDDDAIAFIGLGASDRVQAAFDNVVDHIPVGGYAVVEGTVVNGRPASPSFGPGPHEAVNALLRTHLDFVPDALRERYVLTFNKGGFLRRTAR